MAQLEHRETGVGGQRFAAELADREPTKISEALDALLADSFALYLKTKNFHWRVGAPDFHSYHLVFDEHAEELFTTTDELARRVREMNDRGARCGREIDRLRRIYDNGRRSPLPFEMVGELIRDNKSMTQRMREIRGLCERTGDAETTSLLETLIAQSERRSGLLFEICGDVEG